jgi:hypothetical protein
MASPIDNPNYTDEENKELLEVVKLRCESAGTCMDIIFQHMTAISENPLYAHDRAPLQREFVACIDMIIDKFGHQKAYMTISYLSSCLSRKCLSINWYRIVKMLTQHPDG